MFYLSFVYILKCKVFALIPAHSLYCQCPLILLVQKLSTVPKAHGSSLMIDYLNEGGGGSGGGDGESITLTSW